MAAATQGCASWSNSARPAPRKTAASRSTRHVSDSGPKIPSMGPAAAARTVSRLFSKSSADNSRMSSSALRLIRKPRPQCPHPLGQPPASRLLRARQLVGDRHVVLIALVLVELRLSLDLVDDEIDDADRGEHRLALGGLHLRKIPGLFRQARLGNPEQRVAVPAVHYPVAQMCDTREMHGLIE